MARDVQYRKDFVKGFGELFAADGARNHYEDCGIDRMEYDEDKEVVRIHYDGGSTEEVNVSMDSLAAIAYDVLRYALI